MRPLTVLKNLWARRARIRRMDIRPGDLVLEVGSGHNPSPRADVLCDRFLLDDTERNREGALVDRPFAVGDICALPFGSGSFDYVICSHVLEHLEDPARAAAELRRVAPRGYVEVPSRENELLLPFPFHRWLIDREDDALVFRTKERTVPDPGLRDWFGRMSAVAPGFPDLFFRKLHDLGNVHGFVWKGELPVRVEGPPGPVEETATRLPPEVEVELLRERLPRMTTAPFRKKLLDRLAGGGRRREPDILELVACPVCGSHPMDPAGREGESGRTEPGPLALLRCRGCGREYPLLEGGGRVIPYLIP